MSTPNAVSCSTSFSSKIAFRSKYLTGHLEIIDDFVVNINMDMIGRGSEDSIYVIGSDRLSQEFHGFVNSVNANGVNMYLDYSLNDPNHRMRLFTRSDHYNYARKNIPVVFFFFQALHNPFHQTVSTNHIS